MSSIFIIAGRCNESYSKKAAVKNKERQPRHAKKDSCEMQWKQLWYVKKELWVFPRSEISLVSESEVGSNN